jgi:CIC family chloride channel protein
MTEGAKAPDSSRSRTAEDGKFDAGDWVAPRAIRPLGRLPLLAAMLGVFVGCVGVAFFSVSQYLANLLFGSLGGMSEEADRAVSKGGWFGTLNELLPESPEPRVWLLFLVPALGGLLVGLFRWKFKDHYRSGTSGAIESFHQHRGQFPRGILWRKLVASTLTLGTGGSAGREGPIALMGSVIGSWIANKFNLTVRERRILLAAGIAAGVGGMFRAPLAGGIMAAEVLYSDSEFEPDVLVPSMLASVTSYCVFCLNFGWGSLFGKVAADYTFANPLELFPLTALGLALAFAGFLLVRSDLLVHKLATRLPLAIRPMVGMGLAGLIAIGVYYASGLFSGDGEPQQLLFAVMGDGYAALNTVLTGNGLWWVLLLLAGTKILTSSLTISSGGAGGTFAPSMVIGGTVGAATGVLFYSVLPTDFLPAGMVPTEEHGLASVIAVFALVGMAGFWAGVAKAPISAVLIVSELTGSYHLLLPAMWTCAITFILARRFKLFETQVATRKDSPAHLGDFAVDVLKEMKVNEILEDLKNYETIEESTSLQQILTMKSSRQAYFPVVTRNGRFAGIFSLNDVRAVLDTTEVWQLLVAADIAHHKVLTVHPRETLAEVANKFAETSYDELPVVADEDESRLVGMISRRQLNNAYIRRVMHYDQAAKAEASRPVASGRFGKVSS